MSETGARVPLSVPLLSRDGVFTARAVRGGAPQWGSFAAASNHLFGRGRQLIPCSIGTVPLSTTPETLDFYVWPTPQATTRLWALTFEVKGGGGGTVVFDDGTTSTSASYGSTGFGRLYHMDLNGSLGGAVATSLAPTVALGGGSTGTVELQSVACWEIPRPDLALDATDRGVRLDSLNAGRMIAGGTGAGVPGLAESLRAYEAGTFWRSGLFHFARGTTSRLATVSGSLTNVFLSPPPLLGTKRYTTSTTRTVEVYARAASGAGTTGEIVFTMASGDSLTLTVTSAMSPTWLNGTIDIDCEDLSASDGRRSTRDDFCTVQWRRTGGANPVFLESIATGGEA